MTAPMTPQISGQSLPPGPSSPPRQTGWALLTLVCGAVLVESLVETALRGSPLAWGVGLVAACWALLFVLCSLVLGWGSRLFVSVAALVGLVVWAVWKIGASTEPGLHMVAVSLPRLIHLLIIAAIVLAVLHLLRLPLGRLRTWLWILVLLGGTYGVLPFVFGAAYGVALDRTVRGDSFWTAPPLWLQGGYLALQLLLPVGLIVALASWLWTAARRDRRPQAVMAAVSCVVLAGAYLAGMSELARAGVASPGGQLLARLGWTLPPRVPASSLTMESASERPADARGETTGIASSIVARAGATSAVELRVDRVELTPGLGDRSVPPGRTFVIVDTTWTNLLPMRAVDQRGLEAVPYVVASAPRQLWLLADGRYAEPIDQEATMALAGHLPLPVLTIAKAGEYARGRVVFQTSASASYLALALLDPDHGNLVVPVKGRPADAPSAPTLGAAVQNQQVSLAVTEAGWATSAPPSPPGFSYYTLTLRGTGLAERSVVELPLTDTAFLQTDEGFVAEIEPGGWLRRPLGPTAVLLPGFPNEGQLAFLLPAGSRGVRFLLRPPSGGPIDLPVSADWRVSWPTPISVIEDGEALRVLRLPWAALPPDLPAPEPGRRLVVLDVVVENLKPTQAIQFDAARQLRLADGKGAIYAPSPESERLALRPAGRSLVPPSAQRRFQLLYEVPAGQPLRLEYRGFERSATIDLR